jgi:hypothetical protein
MEREFEVEWQGIESDATAFLLNPPLKDAHFVECHAVMLPSFEDCSAYTLMASGADASSALVVRRVWRRGSDLAKFEGPVIRLKYGPKLQPTIEEEQASVCRELVDGILDRAANLRIPPCIRERTAGFDGESYVLSFGSLFVATRFQWWCEPPEGWEGLGRLLHEVVDVVKGGLASR